MAGKPSSAKLNLIEAVYKWIVDRLERTVFMGLRFAVPKTFLSPMGFTGMMALILFVILGITGALLMFYYQPTLLGGYRSVKMINDEVEFGFIIRNIHYHASNAMVFVALLHMFYLYFSGRYKIRNEILWVTGIILGTVTILVAFTGYDLILNERAVLAISIAVGLVNSIPSLGPMLQTMLFGAAFSDIVLRFYALHVFILPMVMVVLIMVHVPRNLILDIPMLSALSGIMFVITGVSPVPMEEMFTPDRPPGITVPEWYLSALYAGLRTGIDKFLTGVLAPGILILIFAVVPFFDKTKKISWKERPFFSALGIALLAQIGATTGWGFYINPDKKLELVTRLMIDPIHFFVLLIGITLVSFGLTYAVINWSKKKEHPRRGVKRVSISIGRRGMVAGIAGILILQSALNLTALQAQASGLRELVAIAIGMVLIALAFTVHLVRIGISTKMGSTRGGVESG